MTGSANDLVLVLQVRRPEVTGQAKEVNELRHLDLLDFFLGIW